MESELVVKGAIVDSWVEGRFRDDVSPRLVLQVRPKGRPSDLMIIEASPSLVPDTDWLEDLGENLCHGSPVSAICHLTLGGLLAATQLVLAR